MPYAQKIILHAPPWDSPLLEEFVEACIRDDVVLVCIVGDDCERVHDVIDELIVADGSTAGRWERGPMTTWHAHQTLAEVRDFAQQWPVEGDPSSPVQEVGLGA